MKKKVTSVRKREQLPRATRYSNSVQKRKRNYLFHRKEENKPTNENCNFDNFFLLIQEILTRSSADSAS